MKPEEEHKDELLKLILATEKRAELVVEKASDLAKHGQYLRDLAHNSYEVIVHAKPYILNWESKKEAWRYANQQMGNALTNIEPFITHTATSSGTAIADSVIEFSEPTNVVSFSMPGHEDEMKIASNKLKTIVNRYTENNEIIALLSKYNLSTSTPRKKSPIDLFKLAIDNFALPHAKQSSASSSLIPMRECINSILAILLKRRPQQEKTKSQKAKVISICKQCAIEGIPDSATNSLAERWDKLIDDLSGSKEGDYSREECSMLLQQAKLFIRELLSTLDTHKLKN